MTLDEMIKHAREVAERIQKDANKQKGLNHGYYVWQSVNADKYRQIAEWLEELKELRKQKNKFDENIKFFNEINLKCHNQGYNKAIDDLTEKIVGYGTYDYYGNVIDVLEIAEKLKEHKTLNIVHCKDCKHWGTGVAGETENVKCCEYGKYMVGENGYCCYAEKECVE